MVERLSKRKKYTKIIHGPDVLPTKASITEKRELICI